MTTCLEPIGWLCWQQWFGDDQQNVVMDREAGRDLYSAVKVKGVGL